MNNQRTNQPERSRQLHRGSSEEQPRQMGDPSRSRPQFGSRDDGRGGDWDMDPRENRQMGAGDDRFGGYSGSYEPRGDDGAPRAQPWDEERFAYPELDRHRRDLRREGHAAQDRYGDAGSRGPDRYSWHNRYGGSSQFDPNAPSNFAPRGPDARQGFDAARPDSYRSSRFGRLDWSGESFAGGRDAWSSNDRIYGIPSGSEPGGYNFNSTWNGEGAHNWSGSNWAHDQDWTRYRRAGVNPGLGGRAPKGYTRSDERIRDDVCELLYRAADVDVSNVSVESKSGTITLEGTVPDRRMKHRIEDLCERCIGVNDVDNRIRVVREQTSPDFPTDRGRDQARGDERVPDGGVTPSAKKGAAGGPPH